MKNSIVKAALVAGLVAGVASAAWAQSAADTIAARQASMKSMGAAMGAIRTAVQGGADLTTVAARAQEIADAVRKLPGLTPVGTGQDSGIKTAALASIWQNKSDYDANAGIMVREAEKLAAALKANDKAGATAQFAATGAQCGACHRPYRQPAQ